MNKNLDYINNKEILLLQGPMGSFFKKLQLKLEKNNNVYRIGFNKGDEFFSLNKNFYSYRNTIKKWRVFINLFFKKKKIKIIFLFGDCRFYHKIAIEEAKKLNIDIYVFEEGYIRPNFITLEKNGVNNFSEISKKKSEIFNQTKINNSIFLKKEINFSKDHTFLKMVAQSFLYYFISNIFYFQYPNYIHHREFSVIREIKYGILNIFRLIKNKILEYNFEKSCRQKYKKQYFFVPLQTHNDFQVKVHSNYDSIEEFIEEVLISFSKYASNEKLLFFKHHPIDRGRKNYYKTIIEMANKLNIQSRVKVIYDVHLPTLLKNAIGTIVINSTVGLSSLHHKTPVLCLGESIYNLKGLTAYNININDFWDLKLKVNYQNYLNFRSYLIENTQINDHFYR